MSALPAEKLKEIQAALIWADERADEGNTGTEALRILAAEVRRLHGLAPILISRAKDWENGYKCSVGDELRRVASEIF